MATRNKKINLPNIVIGFIVLAFALFCVMPMILIFMVSITNEDTIRTFGYSFIPQNYSLYAYRLLFASGSSVMKAYGVSIFVTVVGTLLAVITTSMGAYLLANKNVRYRNRLALFFFITMIFNAGVVPWYFVSRWLGMANNIISLIIPGLMFSPFNLFLTRNFMSSIPDELRECATIDGANDAIIAFRIYFPLCSPVIATIALFYGLGYWNNWFNAIMLVDNSKLYPIQYVLIQMQSKIALITQLQQSYGQNITGITPPLESTKMATAVITVGPIIFFYPFLQKYFVKGLIIGSVKG
jgi:putative aldouronate transport system permease protein